MTAVIQRAARASVSVDGVCCGKIGRGLVILLGVAEGDSERDAALLAEKIVKLRIFSDEAGKMNRSVAEVGGELLVISNFTLLANYRKGNRPDYLRAAAPEIASALYEYFCSQTETLCRRPERGVFGADMQVDLCNDGPVTIVMDSAVLQKSQESPRKQPQ